MFEVIRPSTQLSGDWQLWVHYEERGSGTKENSGQPFLNDDGIQDSTLMSVSRREAQTMQRNELFLVAFA